MFGIRTAWSGIRNWPYLSSLVNPWGMDNGAMQPIRKVSVRTASEYGMLSLWLMEGYFECPITSCISLRMRAWTLGCAIMKRMNHLMVVADVSVPAPRRSITICSSCCSEIAAYLLFYIVTLSYTGLKRLLKYIFNALKS